MLSSVMNLLLAKIDRGVPLWRKAMLFFEFRLTRRSMLTAINNRVVPMQIVIAKPHNED